MSGMEGFLARWDRRKRAAKAPDAATPTQPETTEPAPDTGTEQHKPGTAGMPTRPPPSPKVPEFDLASLPPIESITATSDIRAFLAPGVPAELTRAALRRAWSADPAIRDFIGIAENQWDFTAPDESLGFGSLDDSEEIRRLVANVFGDPRSEPGPDAPAPAVKSESIDRTDTNSLDGSADEEPSPTPAIDDNRNEAAAESIAHRSETFVATHLSQAPTDDLTPSRRRGHGRALPR